MNENQTTLSNTRQLSHEDISQKAKELWESYGRPAGRDEEIWLEAERLLQSPSPLPSTSAPVEPRTPPARSSGASAGGATAAPNSGRSKAAAR